MKTPQRGIVSLRTASHACLEFDVSAEGKGQDLVAADAGGTILLLQKWVHDTAAWESLPVTSPERMIGRMKLDSVEIEDKAPDSHVASTDQDRFGKIFRRNMPYGTVTNHGTMFVGFSADQRRLSKMLQSMAGVGGGARDALTRYARPLTGAYYFVPSTLPLESAIERATA